jgi:hypothetical protein
LIGTPLPALLCSSFLPLTCVGFYGSLGVRKVISVIGGSLGGMMVLEWALCTPPGFIQSMMCIASTGQTFFTFLMYPFDVCYVLTFFLFSPCRATQRMGHRYGRNSASSH